QAKEEDIAAADKIKSMAIAEIDQEKVKAKEQLKQELVNLAMAAAIKIIAASVDEKASKKVLEDYLEKV
ncbi:F0F1 ATP synthase subunit B, partial [Francisella tularensis subsp. holarctica]|nr:F0F1 ATP synthase subunit B [Francisella tularensis subsp. holarctica]